MKISVLMENRARDERFFAEHGLSLLIETSGYTILFDTGQSDRFIKNAERLGIDLRAVDCAVLSHGHYDHGGGLSAFLTLNTTAPVYVNRRAFEPHYNGADKYIGLDPSLKESGRLILTDETFSIADGLTLYACNERPRPYGTDAAGLSVMQDGRLVPDDFRHEQYLLVEEDGRRILISGCSHKGIRNITAWFAPDVLIGGFHLMKHPLDDNLIACAGELARCDTDYYTCHCTGEAQYQAMQPHLPRLHYIRAGDILTI
jgi:7,8-dihydropterin-6-yl-methyl-4-(beta-D-ribofuranosyl)aminobenzene 5'-phosphate synthase